MINSVFSCSPLPWDGGMGLEAPTLLSPGWFLRQPPFFLKLSSSPPGVTSLAFIQVSLLEGWLWITKDIPFTSITQEIPSVSETPVPGRGMKISISYNHSIINSIRKQVNIVLKFGIWQNKIEKSISVSSWNLDKYILFICYFQLLYVEVIE